MLNAKLGWSGLLLKARVYLDALRSAPRAALLAGWWRLLGKRLRARSIMSPLLGRSPLAYRLWLAQGGDRAPAGASQAGKTITIVALVAPGDGLDLTMESLAAEGIEVRLAPSGRAPDQHEMEGATDGNWWVMPLAAGDTLAAGAGDAYRAAAASAPSSSPPPPRSRRAGATRRPA